MPRTSNRPRYKLAMPPTASVRAPRQPSLHRAWVGPVWGVAGFALGVAVWHALGFWDFVGKTVLKGDEDERRLARTEQPLGQAPALRTTGTVHVPAQGLSHGPKQVIAGYSPAAAKALRACSLAIPTTAGDETLVTPCPSNTPIAASGRLAHKVDFGAPAEAQTSGWSFKLLMP